MQNSDCEGIPEEPVRAHRRARTTQTQGLHAQQNTVSTGEGRVCKTDDRVEENK